MVKNAPRIHAGSIIDPLLDYPESIVVYQQRGRAYTAVTASIKATGNVAYSRSNMSIQILDLTDHYNIA